MTILTIVLTDLPKGQGVTVQTNAGAPCIGQPRTPAEALTMDLLRLCNRQAHSVQYGNANTALSGELVKAHSEAA